MNTFLNIKDMVVVIRGGGDLASGIACRLFESGFRPIMTELEKPKTVRRTVSFSSAVFEKEVIIEGIKGVFEDYPFLNILLKIIFQLSWIQKTSHLILQGLMLL